ncbi:acyl-coenzyme A synthetase ACSM3, mitochondrial-like isoform X1 [Rhinatrema bivittatum]|uniref:acyl-coenzyme A synthetase ACSM3, mitochondrial-like isoform X1 n=1 Tax=Rhinatrema bivittatum TaxID=194408 RepID=UPI001129E33F|nr:acyl-coenzyme A synthetase ACSM3, mitochondrial-like isoform X1 [Rhinatrema bivittatum]XP_029432376.1 acyl-coenzyme A synthetase ACSM3, mitochondrial-like isoform X1 [Rhinatrema bivittatum]XP_029432377.1 acyl-coenzyme A synthetase ACSM3, mitochondrial-like isoform X1 [Rhinatrema bivittatum]
MKILLKCKQFRALWPPLASCRLFSKDCKVLAPQNFSDYESIRHAYKPEAPEYFNFAGDVLDKWAEKEKEGTRPSNPALWWIDGKGNELRWGFEELGMFSRKVANVLSEACGLQKGDRVLLILPRVPEWWLFNVACMRAGLILIPGTPQLTAKDILHRLQMSKASCIVTNEDLAPAVDSVLSQCQFLKVKLIVSESKREGWLNYKDLVGAAPAEHRCVKTKSDEPMTIFFTSGTTGSPKMTEHSHSSYAIGHTLTGRYWMDLTPSDIMWNTSDTGWAKSAWGSVFSPWIQGSCVFIHSMPQFEATTVLDTLSKLPITNFCSPSTVYRMLALQDLGSYKFRNLKHCVSAGEPMNPEVREQWKTHTGLEIYEGYGQTETVLVCATFKGMKIKPGSMGKATPAYDVQIVDDHGNVLPPGKEGEIAIRIKPTRPFYLFSRYTDDPEKTASTLRGDFYVTGDRGIVDEDGYFWFVSRSDDVILSAGYRIGPFEVESALMEHPAVTESAVVSSPDPIRGEVVKAFIVLSEAYQSHDAEELASELQEHVKNVTAPYKYPRKVEFVQQLPKTISGKIRRNELRKKEWEKA